MPQVFRRHVFRRTPWTRALCHRGLLVCAVVGVACGGGTASAPEVEGSGSGSGETTNPQTGTTAADESGSGDATTDDTTSTTTTSPGWDVPMLPDIAECVVPEPQCTLDPGQGQGSKACCQANLPENFNPSSRWEWWGEGDDRSAVVIPLVANFTDDNADDSVDLCDTPDVVVAAYAHNRGNPVFDSLCGHLYLLDGATGETHWRITETPIRASTTPAIGDINGDGVPDIVTLAGNCDPLVVTTSLKNDVVALAADGTELWRAVNKGPLGHQHAVALADLDQDGDPEIMIGGSVLSHEGELLWSAPAGNGQLRTVTAANLDGEPGMEVILGGSAYTAAGEIYYNYNTISGHPHVADVDQDSLPEIVVTRGNSFAIIEHDGTLTMDKAAPGLTVKRIAAIHDFNGDGRPDYAMTGYRGADDVAEFNIIGNDLSLLFTVDVDDGGQAGGTAFDFLGDGQADAVYGDEQNFFVFDDSGQALLSWDRASWTSMEYPVVVDVDGNGPANILVVSNDGLGSGGGLHPTVAAVRDATDGWVQAPRIWNQHTYHVTNIREDGTVPQYEPDSWVWPNTFRTQAQREGDEPCDPTLPQ